jgi:hypothetical protein
VCHEGVNNVLGSGDDVALQVLHMTDRLCLTAVDHFEDVEQGWFLAIYFVLCIVVQQDFFFFIRLACKRTILAL